MRPSSRHVLPLVILPKRMSTVGRHCAGRAGLPATHVTQAPPRTFERIEVFSSHTAAPFHVELGDINHNASHRDNDPID